MMSKGAPVLTVLGRATCPDGCQSPRNPPHLTGVQSPAPNAPQMEAKRITTGKARTKPAFLYTDNCQGLQIPQKHFNRARPTQRGRTFL